MRCCIRRGCHPAAVHLFWQRLLVYAFDPPHLHAVPSAVRSPDPHRRVGAVAQQQ
jgi:hypothetical protein